MQFKTLLVSALAAASTALAQRSCGTPHPSEEQIEVAQRLQLKEDNARVAGNATRLAPITVNIYWHVIASSNSVSGGYLTQSTLDRQLDFAQAGADWTINTNWAADRAELTMKRSLRKGTYADLNVYFLPAPPISAMPTSLRPSLPVHLLSTTTVLLFYLPPLPVVACLSTTLDTLVPMRSATGSGGYQCGGNGDYVSDTPFEAEEAYNCEIGRDTCPTLAGTDPVTNYMDYSDDSCFTHFTAGQEARIHSYWDSYRAQYQ
ncbi:metalloprotease [Colletotrichum tofieldiae]|nr:metalloprotease [Colletotrichum tofieldiae]